MAMAAAGALASLDGFFLGSPIRTRFQERMTAPARTAPSLGLRVRAAGRSKAKPRARPKPKIRVKPSKGYDRPNLMRKGRRRHLPPDLVAQRLLESPQLSPVSVHSPLLAACLCPAPLAAADLEWMEQELEEAKEALGVLTWEEDWGGAGTEEEDNGEEEDDEEGEEDEEEEGGEIRGGDEQASGGLSGPWGGEPPHLKGEWSPETERQSGSIEDERGEMQDESMSMHMQGPGRVAPRPLSALPSSLSSNSSSLSSIGGGQTASPHGPSEPSIWEDAGDGRVHAGQEASSQVDQLLYLALMHKDQPGKSRAVKVAGSRLAFLGEHVVEMALAQFLLLRYPREPPASLRERAQALTDKARLPAYLQAAALDRFLFPEELSGKVTALIRRAAAKSVFHALAAVAYLTRGMPEVYRMLFEVFGLDPEDRGAQPQLQRARDDDFLSPELETFLGKEGGATWQHVSGYVPPEGSLFHHPPLFHACVPPGIVRFRGCDWLRESLAPVLKSLAWPRPAPSDPVPLKQRRNEQLVWALLLCFMHPSLFKQEHPRFCYERLEYIGQKAQDLVLAERLLLRHLDAPILWLQDRHAGVLRNRLCARYLRDRKLDKHIWMSPDGRRTWDSNFRSRGYTCAAVYQAIHGCAYLVYGAEEVKRLMFAVWELDGGWVVERPVAAEGTVPLPAMALAEQIGLGYEWNLRDTVEHGFTTKL